MANTLPDSFLEDLNPFDLGQLSEEVRLFYEQFLVFGRTAPVTVREAYLRLVSNDQVKTLFVSDHKFNALARSRYGGHCIALNVAVPCLLHFLYNNALRLEYVFSGVSSSAKEKPYFKRPIESIPLELPKGVSLEEALVTLPGVSRPRDDQRALVATALTEIAGAFCVFHEVGHIIGGHTGYTSSQLGVSDVAEFSGLSFKLGRNKLLRQVWEREADIIAAVMTMSFVLNDADTREHFRECFSLTENDEEYPYQIFSIVLFGIKLLFLYLAQLPTRFAIRSAHPHPLIRATYIHNIIRLVAEDDLGLDIKELDPMLDASTDLADIVGAELGIKIPALSRYTSPQKLSRVVEKEIVRLEEAHKRLQPLYTQWSWVNESVWVERGAEN